MNIVSIKELNFTYFINNIIKLNKRKMIEL